MLDWYSGLIGYDARNLDTGRVILLDPGGAITLTTDRWFKAVGSFESSIQIRAAESTSSMAEAARRHNFVCSPTCYQVSGNPSKFLQGHNVFGPSTASLGPVVQGIIKGLPPPFRPPDADDPRYPSVHRQRVDATISIRMDSHEAVHEFIRHAQQETRSRHRFHQGGQTGSTSMTWGTSKSRWMLTIYCKHCELEKHPVADPEMQAALLDYTPGLLRIELRLYRKELKERGTIFESIIWDFWDRIQVGVMKKDADKGALNLKPSTRRIYLLWADGHDVSPASGLCKRAMFYRYRKEILEATGQDISLPPVKEGKSISREVFGTDYLKEREVKEVPQNLKKYLFEPGESPVWPAR